MPAPLKAKVRNNKAVRKQKEQKKLINELIKKANLSNKK